MLYTSLASALYPANRVQTFVSCPLLSNLQSNQNRANADLSHRQHNVFLKENKNNDGSIHATTLITSAQTRSAVDGQ
jgi:hypothetical protein